LNNENIDVINHSDEPLVMITRALAPAKLKKVELDLETKKATILVADDQVSLAIGKGGQNIRLAGKLSGFDLQLVKEGAEYDIELIEFRDEIGKDVYDKFIENGYDTAQQVITAEITDLVEELEVDEEKLKEIVALIKKEFEEAEVDDEEEGAAEKKAVPKSAEDKEAAPESAEEKEVATEDVVERDKEDKPEPVSDEKAEPAKEEEAETT
jgi:hypothetical protein